MTGALTAASAESFTNYVDICVEKKISVFFCESDGVFTMDGFYGFLEIYQASMGFFLVFYESKKERERREVESMVME